MPRDNRGDSKSPFSILPNDVDYYGELMVLYYRLKLITLIAANGIYSEYERLFNDTDWGDVYDYFATLQVSRI